MNTPQDNLVRYVEQGSREALEELARGHVDLVYSAALRQTGDASLAEDVTQAVFLVLAKKASTIREKEALGGWLLTVTRHVSVNAMKKEIRQRHYERAAAKPESVAQEAAAWEMASPLLDEAMSKLPVGDRDAVVMRFFEDRSFVEIGQAMGSTEEACRKRVTRAVEKLKSWLTARGVVLPAGILAAAIGSYSVQATPAQVASACLGAPSATAEILAKGAFKMLAWKKIRMAGAVLAALALMTGGGIKLAGAGQPVQPPLPAEPAKTTEATTALPKMEVVPGNELLPFAMNMYKVMGDSNAGKNVFYSPISIIEAYGMLQAGTKGDGAAEMAQAFGIPQESMPDTLQKINAYLADKTERPYTLSMANAVWVDNGFPMNADYMKTVKEKYLSGAFNCNFAGDAETERKRVNDWVASNTANKIMDLMPSGSINGGTKLVLTNAIYFKANWDKQFKEEDTREEDFTLDTGSKVKVKMMNQTKPGCSYFSDDETIAASLPYKGQSMSFVAIMPKSGTLADFEKKLTAGQTQKILESLRMVPSLKVALPKYKLETNYNLKELTPKIGIRKIYSGEADLSGLSPNGKGLTVTGAFHKAYVDVDEKGTEAAAATGISAGGGRPQVIPEFIANKPFIFMIQDAKTHTVLFMGRVMNPTGK